MNRYGLAGLCLAGAVGLAGCWGSSSNPPPIETPGGVYRPNTARALPLPLRRWDYDPDRMLLFREGAHERGVFTPPLIALYDWRTNDIQELSAPELHALSAIAQGPGSRTIAYTTFPEKKVILFDVEQQTAWPVAVGEHPAFSPDGKRLAVWQANKLVVVDLETLTEEELYELTDPRWYQNDLYVCCMVWSPDGTRLAYHTTFEVIKNAKVETREDRIIVFNLETEQSVIAASSEFIDTPSWSPDGRLLAYVEGVAEGTALLVVDPNKGCAVGRLQIADLGSAYWSPDGEVIAVTYWVSHLYFVDVEQVFGAKYTELNCP